MKHLTLALFFGAALSAQSADTIESHVAAAQALNASNPTALIDLCTPDQASRATPQPRRGGQPGATQTPAGASPIDRAGRASR